MFFNLMFVHHVQLVLQTPSEDAYCSTPNPPTSTTTTTTTTTTTMLSFVKSAFPPERCGKSEFWPSHAAWEAFCFVLPMQHGKAKTQFSDTSRAGRRKAWKLWRCRFWTIASASCVQYSFIFPTNFNKVEKTSVFVLHIYNSKVIILSWQFCVLDSMNFLD